MKVELDVIIPTSMSSIKLHQYQKFLEITKDIDTEEEESDRFVNLKALEIFCGLELKETYKLPLSTFDSVLAQVNSALTEKTPLIKRFWFKGDNGVEVEYGFIPDLHDMSFGEYVDLDTFISDWSNMHKAMAVLFRPITAKKKDLYQIEPYEGALKYADHMKHMPLNVALGAMVFFYRLGKKLSTHTMDSMVKQMTDSQRLEAEKTFLQQNGVGINQYMRLLEEMSQSLTRLPKSQSISV